MGGDTSGYSQAKNQIQQGVDEQHQIEQGAQQYYSPYNQAGQAGMTNYQNALAQGQNPMQLYNQMAAGYTQSPYLQNQITAGQNAANMANSASGMLGSGAALKEAASQAQGLRANDFNNYMSNIYNLRNQYLGGQQSLMNTGFGAAQGMSGNDMQYGSWVGQGHTGMANADIAQAQQESANNGQWLKLGGTILGGAGGFMLGGPMGAAAGASLGSQL